MKLNIKSPVAILGFGVEGQSALDFLKKQGMQDVTICDEKENPDAFKNLSDFKTIIRSPGVYYKKPEIESAKNAGVAVTSMTEIAMEIAKERITAVTGSNGKTTTTALIAEILKRHYEGKLIIGGNDGKPVVQEALDNPNLPIVMEVSSFQFSDLKMSPHISAILNITPNHLDWHEDLEDYINAKNNLILHQKKDDWAVLNTHNENSSKMAEKAPGQVFWIGEKRGNNWAAWEDDNIVVNGEKIINIKDVKVKTHPDNLLFAAAIAKLHNTDNQIIVDVMKTFGGVEHRLEFVREINGISFYNDSSCTTPESSEVAIDNFPQGKLILMLGGSSKKVDYGFLAAKIKNNNTRAYLYGKEGAVIEQALKNEGGEDQIITYNQSGDFEAIIKDVFAKAKEGDSIVLSPACASFDMFKNAKERGRLFREIVNNL
ncbi:UDP-N-acetylmuramoyl-L-alanine--D-glutamate ligase [Candidatus Peregrinibacteria bacterium]|nr:UDP-N-acetylmuramoyl-L-alanine--D-glutamate ligase [Candidatus Peregrinibacteria bacterium]